MGCGATPGATTTCVNSLCTTACDEGFADCDGDDANGCETDLTGDDANCGGCGTTCGGGECVASTCLLSPRGDGSAGAFNVDGADAVLNTVVSTANGGMGRTEVILGNPMGFAGGQLLLMHQTQGPDAGRFELHRIDSVDGEVATVSPPLGAPFATGAGSVAQAVVVPQYESLTITSGRVIAPAWDGMTGGIVAIAATGAVTVAPAGSIDVASRGFRGAVGSPVPSTVPGLQGEGHLGLGALMPTPNGSGGGGAIQGGACPRSAGGGGGGGGEPGALGTGTCPPSLSTEGGLAAGGDASPIFGGGGGTGGPYLRAGGGAGAGLVMILAGSLVVEGAIRADGAVGATARIYVTTCGGPGGGGGGGSVFADVDTAMLGDALVTALGGAAGSPVSHPYCTGLAAGAGGAGRISIRADTLTGTTNPPAITP